MRYFSSLSGIVPLARGFGNLPVKGMGLAMLGLSVLLFFAANVAAKGILALSKTIRLRILFWNPEPVVIKS